MGSLSLRAAPLPHSFEGTPQDLFEAMLDRIEIVSDMVNVVISDVEPAADEGPWLKNGKQWYVWDTTVSPSGGYVPLDITASEHHDIITAKDDPTAPGTPNGLSTFGTTPPRVWLQLDAGSTTVKAIWAYLGPNLGWVKGPEVHTWTVAEIPLKSLPLNLIQPPALKFGEVVCVSADGENITTRKAANILLSSDLQLTDAGKFFIVGPDGNVTLSTQHGSVQYVTQPLQNVPIPRNTVPASWRTVAPEFGEEPVGRITVTAQGNGYYRVGFSGWVAVDRPGGTLDNSTFVIALFFNSSTYLIGYGTVLSAAGGLGDGGYTEAPFVDARTITHIPIRLEAIVPTRGAGQVSTFSVAAVAPINGATNFSQVGDITPAFLYVEELKP